LNFQESPQFQWPDKADQSQLAYQRSVQQTLKEGNISVNFKKLKNFRIEASDSKLHTIPIPVSPKLGQIFANWFSTLSNLGMQKKLASIALWEKAFFINSDASEIGVGVNLLYQERGKPQATTILVSQHCELPGALKSFIEDAGTSVIRASCAREAFGVWFAVKTLTTLLQKFDKEALPVFLYTDSLAVAFMFLSQHAQNYITQKYISESLQMFHAFEQPFEVLWKRRSEPSAESADLASKLPPWRCSPRLEDRLRKIIQADSSMQLCYPLDPLDMIRLRPGRIPRDFASWHNVQHQSKCLVLIVPPNLQKLTYQNIIDCFLQFSLQGFLIVPRLHFKSWFSYTLQRLGTPLNVDTSPENFESSIFQTSPKFNFQMAIFRLQQ
jgi:hypothetical protein